MNCYKCKQDLPVIKGGEHAYCNVQTLCAPCNHAKGAKLEEVRI